MAQILFLILLSADCLAAQTSFNAVFHRIRLEAAHRSPQIQITQSEVAQSQHAIHSAWAHWLPRLDFQLSQTQSKDYGFINSGVLPSTLLGYAPTEVRPTALALKINFPIYRRSVHLDLQRAYRQNTALVAERKAERADLDWKLRHHVSDYLLKAYQETTVERSIQIARTNEKDAVLRSKLGQTSRIDTLRAKANLVSLESKRKTFSQDRLASLAELIQFSGITKEKLEQLGLFNFIKSEPALESAINDFAQLSTVPEAIAPYIGKNQDDSVELDAQTLEALDKRIAVSSPHYQLHVAREDLSHSKASTLMAQEWPELSLQGQYNRQSSDYSGANQSYAISAVLTIPFYVGGSAISAFNEVESSQKTAAIQREMDISSFRNQVHADVMRVRSATKQLESLSLNRDQNEEILRLSTESYRLGKATMVELLSTQNDFIESKIALAKAKLELVETIHRLSASLGVEL